MIYKLKHIRKISLVVIIVISNSSGFAQSLKIPNDTLSFRYLNEQQDSAYYDNNFKELERIIKIYNKKAKSENNHLEIARSLFYRTVIYADSVNLKYCDSIIQVTMHSDHIFYPTLGYIRKGEIYYHAGKFDKSLNNYLIAYDLASQKNCNEDIQLIAYMIAAIRNINGQPKEAMNMYQKSLSILKKTPNYQTNEYSDFIILINNIALSHLRLKQLDSANYYSKVGMKESVKMNDSLTIIDFKMINAQINFYKKQYQKVIDSISLYVANYDGIDKATKLYYLGKSHQLLNQNKEAINYFKQIDTIATLNQDPFDEIKIVYQELILDASNKGQDNLQLEYIEKFIHFDSIMSSYKANVFNTTTVSYDLPLLKKQKSEIQERLGKKSKWNLILLYLSIIGIVSIVYFVVREKHLQLKIKKLLDQTAIESKKVDTVSSDSINVPNDIIATILSQLEKFERNKGFLDKDIDLSILSRNFETNTSYLSMVINHYKELSFPNYLKKIRIDYALLELSTNSDLLKYNYQGLAEIFGFKTSESFSRAFYSNTGVHPSKIIKQLKKKIKNDDL